MWMFFLLIMILLTLTIFWIFIDINKNNMVQDKVMFKFNEKCLLDY